jgi:hypothetical protein
MFSLLGVLSQAKDILMAYNLTSYDNVVLSDSPLIYLPLTRNSFSTSPVPYLRNFYMGGSITSTVGSAPSSSNPILNGTSNSTIFNVTTPLILARSLSSSLNLFQNKTIEFWYRHTSTSSEELISDSYATGSNVQFTVHYNNSPLGGATNKIGISNFGSWTSINTTTTLTVGTIYHVVFTWSNSTVNIYLNGNLDRTASWTTFSKSTGDIFIGRGHNTVTSSNAFMSHVAIYNSVLSASRVLAHYNARS